MILDNWIKDINPTPEIHGKIIHAIDKNVDIIVLKINHNPSLTPHVHQGTVTIRIGTSAVPASQADIIALVNKKTNIY